MSSAHAEPIGHEPSALVLVGAAAGIGRWFSDHVLAARQWSAVTLIDASDAVHSVDSLHPNATRVQVRDGVDDPEMRRVLGEPGVVAVLAVPLDTLADVARWLLPLLNPSAHVVDLSHDRMRANASLQSVRPNMQPIGVHTLFGINAVSPEGQTFVVCPTGNTGSHGWLQGLIERVGGTVNVLTAEEHDRIMRYVQTASHHALLALVGVLHESGLDLERDLWANRTPVFEVLLALASRVLTPGQDAVTASIQYADTDRVIGEQFASNLAALQKTIAEGALAEHLVGLRAPFPGSLFTKIQQVGAIATSAVQATRTEIARQRRADGLVGVRSVTGNDKLHVGRIETVTATSFVLEELLVGQPGRAALLVDDAAIANAKKLGIGGKTRRVEFALGRVRVLSNDELEAALDEWLPTVSRGVKVLVPESISGHSVVHVVEGVFGVTSAELVSEEVRLGQREIVVRVFARNDRDLDALERHIGDRTDKVFVWPDGVVLPMPLFASSAEDSPVAIGFLGPAGTFSQTAAMQLERLVPGVNALAEFSDFAAILRAVSSGEVGAAVVPIANSSSGLVDLAAGALLEADSRLVAGGVIDVLVRFDAYVPRGTHFAPGLTLYTHPQVVRQCSQFIAAHSLQVVECSSTAEACRRVAEQGHGVAIANVGLQDDVGLDLARTSVGNLAGAVTRFLVVARHGSFDESPRKDSTLRSVWLVDAGVAIPVPSGARFDELLHGPSGRTLVISTDSQRLAAREVAAGEGATGGGVRCLGTFPWSPRTPVVVVS